MPSLTLLSILSFLLSLVNAAWGPPIPLAPQFKVQPGPLNEGGCDAWHSNISALYAEAIWIVKKGYDATNDLKKAPDGASALKWGYQAQGVLNFFAVRMSPETGPVAPPAGSRGNPFAEVGYAGITYYNILSQIGVTQPVQKSISCGSDGVAYINPTDKDPRQSEKYGDDPSTKDWPELNAGGGFPLGAFWWEYGKGIMAVEPGKSKIPNERICLKTEDLENAAVTVYEWGVIFICESLLNAKYQTANGLLKNIVKPGDDLYEFDKIASKTLAHELTHLWDPQVRDMWSVSEANPPSLYGPVAPFTGPPGAAYGYLQSQLLAWNYPGDASTNADNLANFAFLMYAYDFDDNGYGWDFLRTKKAIKYGTW